MSVENRGSREWIRFRAGGRGLWRDAWVVGIVRDIRAGWVGALEQSTRLIEERRCLGVDLEAP